MDVGATRGIRKGAIESVRLRLAHARAFRNFKGETMASTRRPLRRSRSDRMVAGVVGGLADYFSIDPTLARLIYVVGSVVSVAFPGLLVYAILWMIVPEE